MDSNQTTQDWAAESFGEEKITVEEMDALLTEYVEKRRLYDEAKKASSEAYGDLSVVENKVMSALKATGKKSYRLDGVGLFTKVEKQVVTVPKDVEKKRDLFAWIAEQYGKDVLDGMVSINHQKLNSFYNAEVEKHKDNPLFEIPGVDAPTAVETASFRKA